MNEALNGATPQRQQVIDTVISMAVLLISWLVCYIWVAIMSMLEAPWDGAPVKPLLGNWQRTINDFFDGGGGSLWVLAIFFGIQLFLYGRTLIETRSFQTTTLIFGVTNIVVFVVCILFLNGVAVLAPVVDKPSGLTPDDWRYWGDFQRSWLNITSMICWWIGLLWIQPLFARARASTRQ